MNIGKQTYYSRLRLGWTVEEALYCPTGTPLWMWRIEQEEGQPLRVLLDDAAKSARVTGYSMADLAAEWGVQRHTLHHWARKWGIRFPNHCSVKHREAALKTIRAVRPRQYGVLPKDERARRRSELLRALESVGGVQKRLASLLGCRHTAVNDWVHDRRQVPDRWWQKLQEAAA